MFGPPVLRVYLEAVRDDAKETSERKAIALYGLASLGDPVLLQLQSLSTRATSVGAASCTWRWGSRPQAMTQRPAS